MTELVENPRGEHNRQHDEQEPRPVDDIADAADHAIPLGKVQPAVGDRDDAQQGKQDRRRVEDLEHPGDRVDEARTEDLHPQVDGEGRASPIPASHPTTWCDGTICSGDQAHRHELGPDELPHVVGTHQPFRRPRDPRRDLFERAFTIDLLGHAIEQFRQLEKLAVALDQPLAVLEAGPLHLADELHGGSERGPHGHRPCQSSGWHLLWPGGGLLARLAAA